MMEDATSILQLKKVLKQWEVTFQKEHLRKPKREEIENAPSHIQEAYAKYSKLKKSGIETKVSRTSDLKSNESSRCLTKCQDSGDHTATSHGKEDQTDSPSERLISNGVVTKDEANDRGLGNGNQVWGKEFDKKINGSATVQKKFEETSKDISSDYLHKMSSKLFQNSTKFSKSSSFNKNLYKKPSFQAKYKTEVQKVESDKNSNVNHAPVSDEKTQNKDSLEMESLMVKGDIFEKAMSLTQRKVFKKNYDDDVAIPDKFNVKPKSKFSVSLSRTFHSEEMTERADDSMISCDLDQMSDRSNTRKEIGYFDEVDSCKETTESFHVRCESLPSKQNKGRKSVLNKRSGVDTDNNFSGEHVDVSEKEQNIMAIEQYNHKNLETKSRKNCKVKHYEEVDFTPGHSSHDVKAPAEETKISRYDRKSKTKHFGDQDSLDNQSETLSKSQFDYDECDTDIPVIPKGGKKRKATKETGETTKSKTKRRKLTNTTEEDETKADDEEVTVKKTYSSARPKATASASSGGNFIKLNMKVKTYKRKGKGMTGPQYKRFQWKQKMKARSKSFGDKCFKCGQSGHWSNKCPEGQKETYGGEGDVPPVLEENFPSLKEAAMMAKGVKPESSQMKMKQKKEKTMSSTVSETNDLEDINWDEGMDPEDSIDAKLEEELEVEAGIVRSKREMDDVPPPVSPLFIVEQQDQTDMNTIVKSGLQKFGYEQFRHGQEKAVMRILEGKSTLVVLSTGGGKSLCYQLPAYLYAQRSKVITIVISPLVSLMEDQITGLPPGIKGACLHTNMTQSQREGVLSNVKDGKVHFLLVSPEAVAGGGMALLNNKSSLPPISFVCIDEAHCLSEWSHNFRPSYLRLTKVLREKFGVQCFLGLTATATKSTASDVARHLGISDLEEAVIRGPAVPRNLFLSVSRDENRDEALIGLLQGQRFSACESIIVYCTRREQTERLATLIRTCLKDEKGDNWDEKNTKRKGKKKVYAFWDAESYHAGHSAAQRKRVQNAFMSGRLRVVIATVAFGMGLDKSDVRGVIHYNMPRSFEGYVQEIGRAGRDGKPSHCHLFLDSEGKDLAELKRHTYSNTVDYRTLKKFLQKVFPACRCKQVHQLHKEACSTSENNADTKETDVNGRICLGHERALSIDSTVMDLDVKEEGISTLLCYLELHQERWVENLTSVYSMCKIQCYGGPPQLQAVSKKCPPVAVAIAKAKKDGKSFANSNQIEFPIIDISDCMGWDSGPVKRELKTLSWDFNRPGSTGPRKSGVMVEFSDLAFHFRSPGDLSDDDIDDVLQFLHTRIQKQEKSEIGQLNYLNESLRRVSHKNYWMCADELDEQKNDKLKAILKDYFSNQELPQNSQQNDEVNVSNQEVSQAIADIRQLINIHGQEHKFNGRAIARIFHGIGSPCFPAQVWGRTRRFWRSHMDIDFNFLIKIATQELVKFR